MSQISPELGGEEGVFQAGDLSQPRILGQLCTESTPH